MKAFVFPGQGSQKVGMGAELFNSVAEYQDVKGEVESILGYSIEQLCLEDPEGQINNTQYTQPALYVVSALHFFERKAAGETADYYAGHSLGEYNALLAGGAFDFLTGLKLIKKRGELMGEAKDGGMAAIIGANAEEIAKILQDNGFDAIDVANFNSPAQTVVSGPVEDLKNAQGVFKEAGVRLFKILPVSAAFHSRYMRSAGDAFAEFLKDFELSPLTAEVMSNVSGKAYDRAADPNLIKDALVKQIYSSVQWVQNVQAMQAAGVTEYEEVGPGQVLTKLVQQITA